MTYKPLNPTLIVRHRKENLQKCSLRGLEADQRFQFYSYPLEKQSLPELKNYFLLSLDGKPLTSADRSGGLLLVDGTWRYAVKMVAFIDTVFELPRRSLPTVLRTAYPRYQTGCPLPEQGLASVEALYAAYAILGWPADGILDNYFWREQFLRENGSFFSSLHLKKR